MQYLHSSSQPPYDTGTVIITIPILQMKTLKSLKTLMLSNFQGHTGGDARGSSEAPIRRVQRLCSYSQVLPCSCTLLLAASGTTPFCQLNWAACQILLSLSKVEFSFRSHLDSLSNPASCPGSSDESLNYVRLNLTCG